MLHIFYYAAEGFGSYRINDRDLEAVVKEHAGADEQGLLDKIKAASSPNQPMRSDNGFISVIGSSSHATGDEKRFVERLAQKVKKITVHSAGSSLKFCRVAEGRADLYPRFGPTMEWDTAAGQAIVEQAGGKVINIVTGKALQYNKENLLNPSFVVLSDKMSFVLDMINESISM